VVEIPTGRYELRGDWTDEQGTVHYTDRLTAVPDRYRAKAKRGEPS
jgi:hypothetical protein